MFRLGIKYASQLGLKVVLSGDGGDELFGGYNRHIFAHYFQKSGLHQQSTLASGLARILKGIKTSSLDLSQNTLAKLVNALQSDSNSLNIYDSLLKRIDASKILNSSFVGGTEPFTTIPIPFTDDNLDSDLSDLAHSFRLFDTQFYLPSDILVKVDRASMSNSLEIRSPFLDTTLFNFAWSLPSDYLFSSNLVSFSGKRILRTLLSRYLPNNITGRPKHGFSVPMSNWLRGPLKNWAAELLHPTEINRLGLLDSSYVSRLWDEHLCGAYDHSNVLWSIIVWQDWSNRYIK